MEQAGVHVVHGFADVKIHAKMTLVVRREEDGLRRYVHIGTGNYNASTARLYEDVGLFTADEDIAADVADLFNYVTGFGRPQRFRKLIVAPFTMRSRIVEEIRRVATAAAEGQKTRIRLKTNALVDPTIVEELYAASAGRRPGRDPRPLDLHAPARCRGPLGDDPRPLDRRPLPRAQPDLLVRGGGQGDRLLRQRRPHAAQPRPAHRGPRPGRGRPCPCGGRRDPRQRVRGHRRTPGSSTATASGRRVAGKARRTARSPGAR